MNRFTETLSRSYCYYGNGERWRKYKYTTDFDART